MYQAQSEHDTSHTVRIQLTQLIKGGHAHVTFEQATDDLPAGLVGIRPEGLPYSIWQLAEHIRIAQRDILEFCRNPEHRSPKWPDEYWPQAAAPESADDWKQCLQQVYKDREDFLHYLNNPNHDLYEPFAHGEGQNLLREALLIADHTSYHTGEIMVIRRLLNAW